LAAGGGTASRRRAIARAIERALGRRIGEGDTEIEFRCKTCLHSAPANRRGVSTRRTMVRQVFERTRVLAAGIVAATIFTTAAAADQARLVNGDRLTGKVTGVTGDAVLFDAGPVGAVKIPKANIAGLVTDANVTVEFADGGYATGRLSGPGGGALVLSGAKETSARFTLADVKAIHPGDKIPAKEFKWSGRANVGYSKTSGNTDTEAYNVNGEALGRGERDRIKLSGEYLRESSSGTDTADNSRLAAQYDRFFTKRWFGYLQASAERDDFEDLNLRTTIGAGAGYQIIDTEITKLSAEAGPTYVNEDYETTADRDFVSARWAINFTTSVYDKFADLFHNQEGLMSLDNTSDVRVQTRQGVRVPIRGGFNVTAQFNLDYDNEPAPGTGKTDKKYLLTLGYEW
jgi:putative salt-induced outer membrane protein YdiY